VSLASRKAAVRVLAEVLSGASTLDDALDKHLKSLPTEHQPWVRSACYETMRHLPSIQAHWQQHVKKPPSDPLALAILNLGTTQLLHLKTPAYAAVNESVKLTRAMKKPHLSSLVNSVLRKVAASEQLPEARTTPATRWDHPQWWVEKMQQQWPEHWQDILRANNQKAPFWLRHNAKQPDALDALRRDCPEAQRHPQVPSAWRVDARPVSAIPGFESGHFSVQDAHAQWAALLLDPHNGEHILDACAAPGGKTGHLWERAPEAHIVAVDVQTGRLQRVRENLLRLQNSIKGHPVQVLSANLARPGQWPARWQTCQGKQGVFDRILLDVPCSASGVVRRHPDIKFLRQPKDIERITRQQADILEAASGLLKPGGQLLYATCSVFDEENEQQVERFLSGHPEFQSQTPELGHGLRRTHGVQLLPETAGGDGFYYALLKKRADG